MFHRLFIGALGSILMANSLCVQDVNTECRHHGVFQKESGGRYQLDFKAAAELCQSLGTTLATLEQLKRAQEAGYETCRYGWIQGPLIAIPRVNAHPHCAQNNSGVYTGYKQETKKFDVFCFNATEYEMCGSENSSLMLSPAEPAVSRISNTSKISGKSTTSNSHIMKELPLVTSAKSRDIVTTDTMAAESKSPTFVPGPVESSPHSSLQSGIQSTASPSVGNSGLPEEQLSRPASSMHPSFTKRLDTLPTTLGYVIYSLSETTLAMHASESAGDMTPYIESSREITLNIENQVTEAKLEQHSDTGFTILDSIAQPSPSAVISGNALGINTTMGSTKVTVNRSDFLPTLEGSSMLQTNTESEHENMSDVNSTWSPETTQKPTMFEHGGGSSSIPMTPNPTEIPEETTTSTAMFTPELLLDHRAVEMPDGEETSSPDLTVGIGSTPKSLSSESAKVHLDLMTVTVFDTKWIPSKAPSPDPSGMLLESGSTSEILSSEPTETLSEYSTALGDNRRFSISASPDPAVLFVESGSTPEILRSETLGFSPDFTVTTDGVRISTSQQATPGSRGESDLPARATLQDVDVVQTPSERLPAYLSTAAMAPSTIPDRLTSPLLHSSEMSSIDFQINVDDKREIKPTIISSKQSTPQLKLITPGLADTTRVYSTSDFGWTATSRTTTNQITQMSLLTVGTQQYDEPSSTEISDLVIVDNGPSLKLQPTTTDVGEKPPGVSLDWLIVVGIIVSLLIIVIGGLVIIYSKRLCGRKKSLPITRPRGDNAAIMENGNGRDLVEECGLKADIKRSDEWIQLMNKDDVKIVSEPAEAARLMNGEESGEPSNRETIRATQEEEAKS
ncbi:uncharacterized protein LOC144684706 isoform X1 [Cetorhinus maximus]